MDARTRYFRQVRRLRRSARRWSVLAGTFGGASAVLVPYHGLGWPDAIWAALTGGTAAVTLLRGGGPRGPAAPPAPPPGGPAPGAAPPPARGGARPPRPPRRGRAPAAARP